MSQNREMAHSGVELSLERVPYHVDAIAVWWKHCGHEDFWASPANKLTLELSIEFVFALIAFLGPYGAQEMGLPHNFGMAGMLDHRLGDNHSRILDFSLEPPLLSAGEGFNCIYRNGEHHYYFL